MVVLLAFLALLVDFVPSDRACGASTDDVVLVRVLPRDADAAAKVVARWARKAEHRDDWCVTVVFSPIDGSDGRPVRAPLLLVFRSRPDRVILGDPKPTFSRIPPRRVA